MRLGILDIGSNTVHLVIVDAARGRAPTPIHARKTVLRLVDAVTPDGVLVPAAVDELVRVVTTATRLTEQYGCRETLVCATSVLRDAANLDAVRERIVRETGVLLRVLTGADEARLIFLAARRWFGWSAGNLLVIDIGGGSLEFAMGRDEEPVWVESLPLGAARITRKRFTHDPPPRAELASTTEWLVDSLGVLAERFDPGDRPDRIAATSQTFRSLARIAAGFGAPGGDSPGSPGGNADQVLSDPAVQKLITFLSRWSTDDLAELDGVSRGRAHQLLAGALVAQATMRVLSLSALQICPWALREGVILRRLDQIDGLEQTAL